mmetsp:Transcript_7573/g.20750  ORF Transcript_7573/g.20750 Transcript_7573/m.20750 type:complete len:307 (+) Transcript_7573:1610-2530(+)
MSCECATTPICGPKQGLAKRARGLKCRRRRTRRRSRPAAATPFCGSLTRAKGRSQLGGRAGSSKSHRPRRTRHKPRVPAAPPRRGSARRPQFGGRAGSPKSRRPRRMRRRSRALAATPCHSSAGRAQDRPRSLAQPGPPAARRTRSSHLRRHHHSHCSPEVARHYLRREQHPQRRRRGRIAQPALLTPLMTALTAVATIDKHHRLARRRMRTSHTIDCSATGRPQTLEKLPISWQRCPRQQPAAFITTRLAAFAPRCSSSLTRTKSPRPRTRRIDCSSRPRPSMSWGGWRRRRGSTARCWRANPRA